LNFRDYAGKIQIDTTKSLYSTYIQLKAIQTSRVSSPYDRRKGEGEKVMYQNQSPIRRSSGAKAIEVDQRAIQARYRLLQLIALLLSAGFAVSLQLIFGR
jgi:hypothetical protein